MTLNIDIKRIGLCDTTRVYSFNIHEGVLRATKLLNTIVGFTLGCLSFLGRALAGSSIDQTNCLRGLFSLKLDSRKILEYLRPGARLLVYGDYELLFLLLFLVKADLQLVDYLFFGGFHDVVLYTLNLHFPGNISLVIERIGLLVGSESGFVLAIGFVGESAVGVGGGRTQSLITS